MQDAKLKTTRFGKIEANGVPQPIGEGEYNFVKLQPRYTNTNGTVNQAGDVLFGDVFQQTGQLTPGLWSEWIPIQNLSEIYAYCLLGSDGVTQNCTLAWVASDRTN
jgi:hypothetical protein